MAAAFRSACSAAKCGAQTSRQSATWSTVCHGVSVPPQSKMTARTTMIHILCAPLSWGGRPSSARSDGTDADLRTEEEQPDERPGGAGDASLPGRGGPDPRPDDPLALQQQRDLPARADLERVRRHRPAAVRDL